MYEPSAAALIEHLSLQPHPEGGHYRRVHTSATTMAGRPALSVIRFLLRQGEASRWHRVDADECWHWQQGGALELLTLDPAEGRVQRHWLGPDAERTMPLRVVPAGIWQAARTLGAFTLVACTVAPGFIWEGFELMREDDALATLLRDQAAWID